jgi:hypothetical protein
VSLKMRRASICLPTTSEHSIKFWFIDWIPRAYAQLTGLTFRRRKALGNSCGWEAWTSTLSSHSLNRCLSRYLRRKITVEISVRNLLGNPGARSQLCRRSCARRKECSPREHLQAHASAGGFLKGPVGRYPNHLACDRQSFSLSGIEVMILCSQIQCSALRRRVSRNWLQQ